MDGVGQGLHCTIHHYPGKANVISDALSHKARGGIARMLTKKESLVKEFATMNFEIATPSKPTESILASLVVRPIFRERIKEGQG